MTFNGDAGRVMQALPFLLVRGDEIWNELTQRPVAIRPGELEALRASARPVPLDDLAERLGGPERVAELIRDKVLVEPAAAWELTEIQTIEIEISTRCNWRCEYCPVSLSPKPAHTMPLALFEEVIFKARRHGIGCATLNSYNEPTIDPLFDERIGILARTPLRIQLHTNGAGLSAARLALLAESGVVKQMFFNLPSLDPERFRAMTGAPPRTLERLRTAIARALELGLTIGFSIQGTSDGRAETVAALRHWLGARFRDTMVGDWPTTDRAGALGNQYGRHIGVRRALTGCADVLNWLCVAVNGDCFLCCEDYYQKVVFGNVRDGELADVLGSPRARQIRRWVYGAEDAPADFLCRSCHVMASHGVRPGGWRPLGAAPSTSAATGVER